MDAHAEIARAIDNYRDKVVALSHEIHEHPELKFEEHFAAGLLTKAATELGLEVEREVGGLKTAFRAEFGAKGPAVAILAEYDALPNGHSCGHNLIAGAALSAVAGLKSIASQLPGRIVFLGTPAEEGGGGKIILIDKGALRGVDAAMMAHPTDAEFCTMPALATQHLKLTFHGHGAHAALAPWDGSSALAAVIQTFQSVDAMRLHLRDGSRIHGIITDGGQAVNIIPERTECLFLARAKSSKYAQGDRRASDQMRRGRRDGDRDARRARRRRRLQKSDQQSEHGASLRRAYRGARCEIGRGAGEHADRQHRHGRRQSRDAGDTSLVRDLASRRRQLPRRCVRRARRLEARLRRDDSSGEGDGDDGVRFARGSRS